MCAGDWYCPKCNPASSNKRKKKSSVQKSSACESEDECMVCGFEGSLVLCDFPGCTKVFHRLCIWPHSASADSSAQWICPRHTCVACGYLEPSDTSDSLEDPCFLRLRKCSNCPLAYCSEHVCEPPDLSSSPGQFKCAYCADPSPRTVLATVLQGAWSKMVNNYLSKPFLRPLLSVSAAAETTTEEGVGDLFGLIERVRELNYGSCSAFLHDMRALRGRIHALDADQALQESYSTLCCRVENHFSKQRAIVEGIEGHLSDVERGATESLLKINGRSYGLGGHAIQRLPDATPIETIEFWREYVREPPVDGMPAEAEPISASEASDASEVCNDRRKTAIYLPDIRCLSNLRNRGPLQMSCWNFQPPMFLYALSRDHSHMEAWGVVMCRTFWKPNLWLCAKY